jgi:hypothetical protein
MLQLVHEQMSAAAVSPQFATEVFLCLQRLYPALALVLLFAG